eukprot:CAMPEP_0118712626 /NCGR_PEP_ID=MMETSP0800-20121206/24949_1 /TAXON_ID=210618 ORGANISM="Striatella unipunctata, Strain CCMP2910" /NCGR_SAMPLE_ID=MMETSP0800 /ASSEMBLY_ACC=CAM_ASM_000638 /LENGTH=312 /DNA_ID=CAMNT_0006617755 /DNA_START=92 /DNA_END=1030 /DNA_ORIENTATION=-
MEAKLGSFDVSAEYQSRSNAIDAHSQHPTDEAPWPLLLFRYGLHHNANDSVSVLAFVPTGLKKAKAVRLWQSNPSHEDAIYQSVVAALRAANLALDEEEHMVYKCFFDTQHRRDNLELVQKYVDPKASKVSLGRKGCFIKMKWIGKVMADDNTCSMLAFLQIARELRRLHTEGFCHGDIRVSNLILDPVTAEAGAKLVDFDLAGKTGEQNYPGTLWMDIIDGERHEEIQQAIKKRKVHEVTLETKHDVHSLVAAMKCFEVMKADDQSVWNTLVKRVRDSGPLNELNDSDLVERRMQLKDDVLTASRKATGSP